MKEANISENVGEKEISRAVIKRLPRYYRYLGELIEEGTERISSGELSRRMNVTASQIRQDLNNFGGFGQQGYGYNVRYLYEEIGKILGLDKRHNIIIIGGGNLGQALANYVNFERRGFFVRGIEIHMMDDLEDFIKNENIHIAVLTLPKANAVEITDRIVGYGIKAIWNFAHVDLDVPPDVIVESVHLSESLMRLSYNLTHYEREHGE